MIGLRYPKCPATPGYLCHGRARQTNAGVSVWSKWIGGVSDAGKPDSAGADAEGFGGAIDRVGAEEGNFSRSGCPALRPSPERWRALARDSFMGLRPMLVYVAPSALAPGKRRSWEPSP